MENKIEKEMTKNVKQYLFQNNINKSLVLNEERITLVFEKLGGLCNENYLVKIVEKKNTNKILFQLVYKKFGIISKTGEHILESQIIEYLSKENIGPKLYLEKKNYRLMEYIPETKHIEKDILFDDRIINQLSLIFDTYNHFTKTYSYNINENIIEIQPLKDANTNNSRINVTKNYYDHINLIYKMAKNSFNKFENEFSQKVPLKGNEETYDILNKFKYYLNNFQDNFKKLYPKEGYLVMCHNDVNRYNFIQKISDGKLYCLDHEYASLNLPGYDIADYLNETNFNFFPDYYFSYEDINYDKYFVIYRKYIEKFVESNKNLLNKTRGQLFFKYITSKRYYLSLHQIINYFWILCSIAYLNFDTWLSGKQIEIYIGKDLIRFYELGLKKLKELD